jgi:hypothetical protein
MADPWNRSMTEERAAGIILMARGGTPPSIYDRGDIQMLCRVSDKFRVELAKRLNCSEAELAREVAKFGDGRHVSISRHHVQGN